MTRVLATVGMATVALVAVLPLVNPLLLTPATSSWASVDVVGSLIVARLPIPLGRDWVMDCRGVSVSAVLLTVGVNKLACSTPGWLALRLLRVRPLLLPLMLKLLGACAGVRLVVNQLVPAFVGMPLAWVATLMASLLALLW